jgi:hypothetical protein
LTADSATGQATNSALVTQDLAVKNGHNAASMVARAACPLGLSYPRGATVRRA